MTPEVIQSMNNTGATILVCCFVLPCIVFIPIMLVGFAIDLYLFFFDKD